MWTPNRWIPLASLSFLFTQLLRKPMNKVPARQLKTFEVTLQRNR